MLRNTMLQKKLRKSRLFSSAAQASPSCTEQEPPQLSSFAKDFYNTLDAPDLHAAVDVADGDTIRHLVNAFGALTTKEARCEYRMALLTPSQWSLVLESCGMPLEAGDDASRDAGKLVKRVMAWRRRRGDFNDDEEEEEVNDIEEVPRLCDDMEGVNEPTLMHNFLKTDLQVECLLRGIPYEGKHSKAGLVSMLLHHKQFACLSTNSFVTLAQESI